MKLEKLNKIKLNLLNFENNKFIPLTHLRNSFQFTATKCRIYQNASRVHTENNNIKSESYSQHSSKYKSLSKTNNKKTSFLKQSEQTPKLSQTQNSFFPSQNSYNIQQNQNIINKGNNNKSNNQNLNQLEIISDGYSISQDKQQQRLKNLLFFNKNCLIQVKNKKGRSISQKN